MLKVTIGTRVRMFFNDSSFGVEGNVEGIERNEDDTISNIMFRSPSIAGPGVLDLDEEVLGRPGFRVEVVGETLFN